MATQVTRFQSVEKHETCLVILASKFDRNDRPNSVIGNGLEIVLARRQPLVRNVDTGQFQK